MRTKNKETNEHRVNILPGRDTDTHTHNHIFINRYYKHFLSQRFHLYPIFRDYFSHANAYMIALTKTLGLIQAGMDANKTRKRATYADTQKAKCLSTTP